VAPSFPIPALPISFVPASWNGKSLLNKAGDSPNKWVAKVKEIHIWQTVSATSLAGYDIALLRLDKPLGWKLGWWGMVDYTNYDLGDGGWFDVGYPCDLAGGNIPYLETGISILDTDSDKYNTVEIETDGTYSNGHSGGPLFAYFESGQGFSSGLPYIVGCCSGLDDDSAYLGSFVLYYDINFVFAGGGGLVGLLPEGSPHWFVK